MSKQKRDGVSDARLKLEYRSVEDLVPYARNARVHSDDQIAQLAGSIREFGWTQPVLVDRENGIIAGHARVLAARRLGLKSVPVIELSHLTDAQRRAYVLADNQLATVDITPSAALIALDQVQRRRAAAGEGGGETTTNVGQRQRPGGGTAVSRK